MENTLNFILKAFFILKIFKYLYFHLPFSFSVSAILKNMIKQSLSCHQLAKEKFKIVLFNILRRIRSNNVT